MSHQWRSGIGALLSLVMSASSALAQRPARTWITDVHIISPDHLERVALGSVLVENGGIVRVERGSAGTKPAGATVISGVGGFLIPGLIDSHVHLEAVPGVRPEVGFGPPQSRPAMIREYFTQLPRSYLYFGYTTLVDPAVTVPLVLDDFRRAPVHPDLYDCGPSLPVAGGYPMGLLADSIGFRLYPNFIGTAQQFPSQDHTPAAAVARVRRAGGICVKTYFDRGYGNAAQLPIIGADVLAEIRARSRASGLVLLMHANSLEAQRFAVDGDVDVIGHGMWNWGELAAQTELPPEIVAVLDGVVAKQIGYQPTMQVMRGFRAYFDSAYLTQESIRKVVPASMLGWFSSPEGQWFRRELDANNLPDSLMRQIYDQGPLRRGRQVVRYLVERNARFLLGTDTPAAPTYGNLPGLNSFLEMQQLREAGLSLVQILRAATIDNARAFGLDSLIGTIEPGKVANLLLLERSPLESVDAYDSIVTVWVHGRAIPRDSLAADRAH